MNLLISIENFSEVARQCTIKTGQEIKRAVLTIFSSDGMYMLCDIYSLDGFEKWNKALIADLEFISLIPRINGVFKDSLQTLGGLKDLYYATMIFRACEPFIEIDIHGKPIGLKLPKLRAEDGGGINFSLISLCIASVLDTAQFLNKCKLCKFAFYSKYIGPIGFYQFYFQLNDIPVLQSLFDGRPKEFFIVSASCFDLCLESKNLWKLIQIPESKRNIFWSMQKWEALFKITASIGTIIGLSCYRKSMGQRWLIVTGLISYNAALFKFILTKYHKRIERFEFPS